MGLLQLNTEIELNYIIFLNSFFTFLQKTDNGGHATIAL
jgi:hypothetical protein